MEIELVFIHQTPVFVMQDPSWFDSRWSRVFGATPDYKNEHYLFPAFPPFIENVLHDLEKVHKGFSLSPAAQKWVDELAGIDELVAQAQQRNFVTKSFDHQLEGYAEVVRNYRWILHWEMGTGKSKVIIDALPEFAGKTLILCPKIATHNWVKEINLHSGQRLSAVRMRGTRKQKLKILAESVEHDVLITSYDTARLYGIPKLYPKVVKYLNSMNRVPSPEFKKILRSINDADVQLHCAQEWVMGRAKPRSIAAHIQSLTKGKPQWLSDFPYNTIVADESHRIKRIQSARTKVCLQLAKKAARRYLLSGTLSQGDPRDLYPQLKFLAPYLMPENFRQFKSAFLVMAPANEHIVIGYKNLHTLNERVSLVSSQRKLLDCVDLPERRFETIEFDLSPAQQRDYNYVVKEWAIERPDASPLEIQNGAIRVSKLLQLCSGFVYVPQDTGICDTCERVNYCVARRIMPGSSQCVLSHLVDNTQRETLRYTPNPKLQTLESLLEGIVPAAKSLVWATHTAELDDIAAILDKNKWKYVRVDGETTGDLKYKEKEFQENEACRIYLGQISMGIALTLTAATYSIYYSRSWKPDDRDQSLGRAFRIGQDKKTVVYDLCAAKTLEVQQLLALRNKDDVSKLLTEKVNCVLCREYRKCVENGTEPWTDQCVLSTGAKRTIANVRTI